MTSQQPASRTERRLPLRRVGVSFPHAFAAAGTVLVLALVVGIAGYHFIAGLSWVDALLEASMILTGEGPIAPLSSSGAKLFASVYAIFSGTVFLITTGILVAPLIHRVLHRFHVERGEGGS